jgi:hypothetical protein
MSSFCERTISVLPSRLDPERTNALVAAEKINIYNGGANRCFER